jgi:hypothetical protein
LRPSGAGKRSAMSEPRFGYTLSGEEHGPRELNLPLAATIRARLEDGLAEHAEDDLAATFEPSARRRQEAL